MYVINYYGFFLSCYYVLRLLEKPSRGHITAPRLEKFEAEVADLERHFRDILAYRGGLASIGSGGYFGQASTTSSVIMKGMIDGLPGKLEAMAERWAILGH